MFSSSIHRLTIISLASAIAMQATAVYASPITANVIGSSVSKKGIAGGEYRNGYEWDDENSGQDGAYTDRIDLFYNVSDDTQFRVFFNRVDQDNADPEFTNLFIEPTFQVFDKEEHGFDGAFTTGLTIAEGDNEPHQVRSILTGTVPIPNGYFRHNSVFAHQFGGDSVSGLRYEARWRVMQNVPTLGESSKLGVEMFNNFGNLRTDSSFDDNMTHRAGPVMTGKLTDTIGFQTGSLIGISDNAPDYAFKFWLNYQFDTAE
jgi:hypothetical protein